MKTKYLTMPDGAYGDTDEYGNKYVDIMAFHIENFEYTMPPTPHIIKQNEIDRFDLFIATIYGKMDYMDIILWLNNQEYVSRINNGDTFYLPSKTDLDIFYSRNSVIK